MPKTENISINVTLDDQNIPEKITWNASGSEQEHDEEIKAFMISFWDMKMSQTLRMDLWTKDMRTDEMDTFFFQTLMTMADTYKRANGDEKITDDIKRFAYTFGERTKLIKKDPDSPESAK